MEHCLKGLLKRKTRLLSTHGLQFLPEADHILFLDGGRIAEQGSYDELVASAGRFSEMMQEHGISSTPRADKKGDEKEEKEEQEGQGEEEKEGAKKKSGKLVSDEERDEGAVDWSVLRMYGLAVGGWWVCVMTVIGIWGGGFASLFGAVKW